jgi:hypothetical protein
VLDAGVGVLLDFVFSLWAPTFRVGAGEGAAGALTKHLTQFLIPIFSVKPIPNTNFLA